jgi:hypothetical protein|tara:strand:- start:190 stop:351 length:162 start_codon:yes stop_codon:yes gene_type:complete
VAEISKENKQLNLYENGLYLEYTKDDPISTGTIDPVPFKNFLVPFTNILFRLY